MLTRQYTNLINALGFLSRLGPAKLLSAEENGAAIQQFATAGLIIGLTITLPFFLNIAQGHPWVQSWIWVGLSIWVTRALHWDGWSDLADAWGSYATGDRFWEILKDSRVGAFGAMSLVFGIAGQLIFCAEIFSLGKLTALIWVPMLGRAANVCLCPLGSPSLTSTQGKLIIDSATPSVVLWTVSITILCGFGLAGFVPTLTAITLLAGGMLTLYRLSRQHGGINGDFLGTITIWGELSAMLGIILM